MPVDGRNAKRSQSGAGDGGRDAGPETEVEDWQGKRWQGNGRRGDQAASGTRRNEANLEAHGGDMKREAESWVAESWNRKNGLSGPNQTRRSLLR